MIIGYYGLCNFTIIFDVFASVFFPWSLTGDETGDNEWKNQHLEHAHENISRERDEHDGLLARLVHSHDETEEETEENSENRQAQQQVLAQPFPRLQIDNSLLAFAVWQHNGDTHSTTTPYRFDLVSSNRHNRCYIAIVQYALYIHACVRDVRTVRWRPHVRKSCKSHRAGRC